MRHAARRIAAASLLSWELRLSTPPRELCPLTQRDERNKALAYLAVFVVAIVFFLWVLWPPR